jgi:transposase InsO family protein
LSEALGVKYLCEALGVSRSGYYDWCKRQPSNHAVTDAELKVHIQRIHKENEGAYGSPRIFKALRKQGIHIGKKRVERLMRELGLVGRVVLVTRRAPGLKRFLAEGENLRLGKEGPTGVDQVWVADITYLKVNKRWMYLSVIMDLYSRRVIAWSLDKQRTTEVTKRTLQYALKKRKPKAGLIFHTDRGIEYKGNVFQDILNANKIKHSLNRLGHCTDNGHMESFFHSMKAELIRGRSYKTEGELRYALVRYINHFYNQKRLHSGIGYHSPVEYEQIAA